MVGLGSPKAVLCKWDQIILIQQRLVESNF